MLTEYSFDNIYIRYAIDETPNDEEFTMHIHEQCEIYFFISGRVDYMVEGSKYPLEENSLMIMRPAEVHKPKIVGNEKYERYAINFPLSFVNSIDPLGRLLRAFTDRSLGNNNMFDASSIDINYVKVLFSQMFQPYADPYNRQVTVKAHIITLLELIGRAFDKRKITKACQFIKCNKVLTIINFIN